MEPENNLKPQTNLDQPHNGFAPIILLLLVIIVALAGVIFVRQNKINERNALLKQGVSVDNTLYYDDDEDDLEEDDSSSTTIN